VQSVEFVCASVKSESHYLFILTTWIFFFN